MRSSQSSSILDPEAVQSGGAVLAALGQGVEVGGPDRAVVRHAPGQDRGLGADGCAGEVGGDHVLGALGPVGTSAWAVQDPLFARMEEAVVVDDRARRPGREQDVHDRAGRRQEAVESRGARR
jgi:hypothetical protein